ncbi:uncharacterized protein FOMMEDRAFT_112989 [Fomitiporia mediterranea MF3/22]|uniref:uncharacterized protein n=1 Tax=Fomitiporia mediterranea (strain MF3/22) TaxID=694068 RepID=UPI0004408C62|nr:uncharacterized protein FOMMEDRAFT_112989 [Fomitiporia mediterranea MF3/22]EJC99454.1 hypothetical protein FOMMEDRAFT_112989 [Fomitiporia mediterranea MF3/22]
MLSGWEWRPRGARLAIAVLSWVILVQMAGLYLFTRGFLLTRMALSDISSCPNGECTLPETHQRVVLLIIDALRFDFVSPNPPEPRSPFHHDILTLPRELTAKYPDRSFLFHSFADPPTTTLQRIKGITTGSLPTFVDVGSSFSGYEIEEDSTINQLHIAGRRIAFMGDDTWMTVFPTLFAPNMTYPYDSFNVEDLHTVDEGVTRHLFPLLEEESPSWHAIVGHFLGVDHVGHRVGPDHAVMKAKLSQMDGVFRRVVDLLADDTLLVVLGDHGMDRKGDHGGDDVYETSAAMWIYSKGVTLQDSSDAHAIPSALLDKATYPGASVEHRWIQQIDIVPTLSLLLGLPIPFNNLGSVIPELFTRSSILDKAIKLNAEQVRRYLDAYRTSASDSELDALWPSLENIWGLAGTELGPYAYFKYMRRVLEECRSLWAQFNVVQMTTGLVVLALSVVTTAVLYSRLGGVSDWESWASKRANKVVQASTMSLVACPVVYLALSRIAPELDLSDVVLAVLSTISCVTLLLDSLPALPRPSLNSLPIILILHAIMFFSNSFTFWEDRIVPFLLISLLVLAVRVGFTAADERLRKRILFFSAIYAICVRLIAFSTVCREEQQPYCHVTFYASSALSASPLLAVILSIPVSIVLPSIFRRFLAISASDKGLVPSFLSYVLRPALLASSIHWICEWLESKDQFGPEWAGSLRTARTVIAWCTFGGVLLGGMGLWWLNPLCIDIRVSKPSSAESNGNTKPKAVVVVNSNAYGAPYLLFWSIAFSLVYLATQLTGQLVLALSTIALLAHLEISDSVRDAQGLVMAFSGPKLSAALEAENFESPPFSFSQLTPLALLGLHAFYATGHQATIASLQWKSAFVFTSTVSFMSRVSVFLNTLGPQAILALAAPLLACWQVVTLSPSSSARPIISKSRIMGESVRASIGVMLYYGVLLLTTAASAAILRRHLMVWKVFAPRFMAAALEVVAVDLILLVGVGFGVSRMSSCVWSLLQRSVQKTT